MQTESGKRVVREYRMEVKAPAGQIFPLLCPVREYEWIPHWSCRLIYSQSGYAEAGCVFQTDSGEQYGVETWVVSHYENNAKIAFVRTGTRRTTRYEITLAPTANSTTLLWRQEITGLDTIGNELVAASTEEDFLVMMEKLERLLVQYLAKTED